VTFIPERKKTFVRATCKDASAPSRLSDPAKTWFERKKSSYGQIVYQKASAKPAATAANFDRL
jgi:hypothetical protein